MMNIDCIPQPDCNTRDCSLSHLPHLLTSCKEKNPLQSYRSLHMYEEIDLRGANG